MIATINSVSQILQVILKVFGGRAQLNWVKKLKMSKIPAPTLLPKTPDHLNIPKFARRLNITNRIKVAQVNLKNSFILLIFLLLSKYI